MADEWTTVTSSQNRRGRKTAGKSRKAQQKAAVQRSLAIERDSLSVPELQELFSRCEKDIRLSSFFQALDGIFGEDMGIKEVVCYGIGNFGEKTSAPTAPQWQLACIMQLVDSMKASCGDVVVHYYEPFMTELEKEFLESKSIKIIADNEKGKRLAKDPTFFFMPHCPMSLYSNLLFTNCGRLDNVVIFGNSLSDYANRLYKNCHTELLRSLEPQFEEQRMAITKEETVELPGAFEQAFNDSSVIRFGRGCSFDVPPSLREALLSNDAPDEAV